MAKKASANSSFPVPTDVEQKKRKKQAKREAKVMLEVEEAKSDVQKAEKKVAKAQALLDARTVQLHTLEETLSKLRTPQEETEISAPDVSFDHQGGQPEQEEETVVSAPDEESVSQGGQPESEFNTASSVQQETVSAEQES